MRCPRFCARLRPSAVRVRIPGHPDTFLKCVSGYVRGEEASRTDRDRPGHVRFVRVEGTVRNVKKEGTAMIEMYERKAGMIEMYERKAGMIEMHERMWARICELPNTPRSMLVLLDEFPEATVEDWHLVFTMLRAGGPSWWPAYDTPCVP
jgi:hypothetical protein